MKKQKAKKGEKLNLFFSAFLILGYIVCTYFFMTLAQQVSVNNPALGILITVVVLVLFGLLLFYATRVGDGTPIKRFSLLTLIVLDIPCLYAILAYIITVLPLHDQINEVSAVFFFACVALGYGIPYTFLSGFEIKPEEEEIEEVVEEKEELVKGGLKEELSLVEEKEVAEDTQTQEIIEEVETQSVEELELLDGEEKE